LHSRRQCYRLQGWCNMMHHVIMPTDFHSAGFLR
jgi:hypothetical protein